MGKVDYSKVEMELEEGLRRMKMDHIFYVAELNAALGKTKVPEKRYSKKQQIHYLAVALNKLKNDLHKIHDFDKEALKQLEVDPKKIIGMIDKPSEITDEQWEEIKKVREKIDAFKKEMKEKLGEVSDEEWIEAQKKKQKNARFNVRDDWLPLH